jgi:NADH dehydrogenase (ubiquinone) 1 alpha/beta subcomplex 1
VCALFVCSFFVLFFFFFFAPQKTEHKYFPYSSASLLKVSTMLGRVRSTLSRQLSVASRARVGPSGIRSVNVAAVKKAAATTPLFASVRFYSAGGHKLTESEVAERVINVVKGFDKVDAGKVTASAHFTTDLGLDSLDAVEVVMALEEEFCIEIPDAEAEKITSTKDAIAYISTHPQAK